MTNKYIQIIIVLLLNLLLILNTSAQTIENTFENVSALAWNSDGTILAFDGKWNGQSGLWFYNIITGTLDSVQEILVMEIVWSHDNTKVAVQVADSNVAGVAYRVYDVATKSEIARFDTPSNNTTIIEWSDTNTQIAVISNNVQIYDLQLQSFVKTLGDL